MGDVRARLVETTDAVVDGGRALAQTSDLREHEPHPVGPLAAASQLGEERSHTCRRSPAPRRTAGGRGPVVHMTHGAAGRSDPPLRGMGGCTACGSAGSRLDLLLGDVHSLKEKRSVVRPIVAEPAAVRGVRGGGRRPRPAPACDRRRGRRGRGPQSRRRGLGRDRTSGRRAAGGRPAQRASRTPDQRRLTRGRGGQRARRRQSTFFGIFFSTWYFRLVSRSA